MREPSFWWGPAGAAAALLSPLALAYGALARQRLARSGQAVGVPVLCVGNPTVGGAGKTPTAIAVAKLLIAAGRHPIFLSRGYGGRLAGPLQVNLSLHCARDVGDEPLLLARIAPTVVARERVAGAALARAAGANAIVMDDGLQNPSLAKNLALMVVDGRRGVGNGRVFPAGPLRAPLDAQLDRAHALLVIGEPSAAEPVMAAAQSRSLPIFHGRLEPERAALAALAGRKVLAFAGIGDPEKFFATLAHDGVVVAARYAFPDHHFYRRAEIAALLEKAVREGLVPVTTEKDFVRLLGEPELAELVRKVRALPVALAITEEAAFRALVLASAAGPS